MMMQKHYQKALDSISAGTLYVVATPIGNLADITLRALAVLQRADLICAEDTRVTAQLLGAYGIQSKLLSVREHNEQQMAGKVIEALSDGLTVAQVSDAEHRPFAIPAQSWLKGCVLRVSMLCRYWGRAR